MMVFLGGVGAVTVVLLPGDLWFDLDLWLLNQGAWVFLTGAGIGTVIGALLTWK